VRHCGRYEPVCAFAIFAAWHVVVAHYDAFVLAPVVVAVVVEYVNSAAAILAEDANADDSAEVEEAACERTARGEDERRDGRDACDGVDVELRGADAVVVVVCQRLHCLLLLFQS